MASFALKVKKIATGQANIKTYNRKLQDLIEADIAKCSFITLHELPLSQAPDVYNRFDVREAGWTKAVFRP